MGRKPCCSKEGLNRGAWTAMEDEILVSYINKHGEGKWGSLPKRAGLNRCGKSCRLRWLNYLRPGIKRGNISDDEEELIVRLHRLLGNRWSLIAGRLPGRTDNEIKNYWNTSLGKRVLLQQGENISCWNKAIAPPPKGAAPKPQVSSDAAGAGDGAPEAMPDTSPIRTKALRCTRVLAGHDPPPEMAAADDDHQVQEPAVDEAVGQQDFGGDHLSIGSVDLDFDGIELGFLSPWHDGAAGSVGDHQFGTCASGADLEELLGAGGHDDGVPSLADLELPWL